MSDSFYKGKKVLVTGGSGFLGSYVVEGLLEAGAFVRVASRRPKSLWDNDVKLLPLDLRIFDECVKAAQGMECVVHLAAYGWGLGENTKHHAQLLTQNVLINTNMLEAAYCAGVKRYLFTSSSSVYSGDVSMLDDEKPWDGDPHPSERYFGWAKRVGEIQCQAYHEQYGMEIAIVRPTNPYGPRDTFDLQKSHVIPALIIKAVARQNPYVVWGSGEAVRSFVHAKDVARGMLLALERYAVCDPLNLASSECAKIGDLARLILSLSGYSDARLVFDTSKPEGRPKKVPTTKRAEEKIGFCATIPLREGLAETIQWYMSSRIVQGCKTNE